MKKLKLVLGYLTLLLIAISMLYPFFVMINLSFVKNSEIFLQTDKIFHFPLTFENYIKVL